MAFDHRTCPDHLAGFGVARFHTAHHTKFTAGHTGQQQTLSDQRRGGVAVTSGVVVDLLAPHHAAGVLVQRHQLGVEGAEDHQVVVQGGATVDHVAAGHDAFGQAVLILPELFAGFDIQRIDARVRAGDKHLAVVHQRLALLTTLLFPTKRHGPHRHQTVDVIGIDVFERRVALTFRAQAGDEHVVGALRIVLDHRVGHLGASLGGGHHDHQAQ